jgi:hypothetical protein
VGRPGLPVDPDHRHPVPAQRDRAAVIGAALLVSEHPLLLVTGIGYATTTLAAFVISTTHGLFGWKEVWSGPAQEVAGIAELAALALLLALAATRARPARLSGHRRLQRQERFVPRT